MSETNGKHAAGFYGNWKIVMADGETLLKVINFPGHESMWVRVVEGTDFEGTGIIDNEPVCSELRRGDAIQYEGGTDEVKPSFGARIPVEAEDESG